MTTGDTASAGALDGSNQALDGSSQTLDPRQRTVWTASALLAAVLLGGGAVLLSVAARADEVVVIAAVGLATLLTARAIVWPPLRWRSWTWAAWPDGLELHHGVITRHESIVPYHRVQQIDVHRGPIERMVGLSTLILRTAAATTDCRLPGVAAEHAEALRHELLRRAGVDDAV